MLKVSNGPVGESKCPDRSNGAVTRIHASNSSSTITMMSSTTCDIKRLKMNVQEKNCRNRNGLGFHVFFLRYFYDFQQIDSDKQQQHIFHISGVKVGRFRLPNNCYLDSADSIQDEKVFHYDVHISTCLKWKKDFSSVMKKAQVSRAKRLNNRKLSGRFVYIHLAIGQKIIVWRKML